MAASKLEMVSRSPMRSIKCFCVRNDVLSQTKQKDRFMDETNHYDMCFYQQKHYVSVKLTLFIYILVVSDVCVHKQFPTEPQTALAKEHVGPLNTESGQRYGLN